MAMCDRVRKKTRIPINDIRGCVMRMKKNSRQAQGPCVSVCAMGKDWLKRSTGQAQTRNENMKAIWTKYLPATNYRGSRIKAEAEGVPAVIVSYDDGARDPHHVAALELCKRMNWTGDLITGGRPDSKGNVYVFMRDERVHNPHQDINKAPGAPCSCRQGLERDNCTRCEGTGLRIDFAAIRNAGRVS